MCLCEIISEKDFFLRSALHASFDVSVDGHGVGGIVISHSEGLRNVVAVVNDLLLCLREGVRDEVDWLHRTYRECQVILSNLIRIKWLHLWLIGHAVGELTDARQNTSTVSLMLTILLTHAELNCEPVDRGEAFKVDLRRTKRGQTYLLRKVRKFLMSKHWSVTHELVDDIRFGCV